MPNASEKLMCSGREWEPVGPRGDAVAVLMSGGVDSSVAAAMLRATGRDVVGVTMQIPSALGPRTPGAELRACCGTGAGAVARQLGIPHYVADVREQFRRQVIQRFRAAYRAGRTPSPCIDCNTFIKFGIVMRLIAEALGIERVATGHYARIVEEPDGVALYAGADGSKDQSYFLAGVRRQALSRVCFPVGEQTKERTREMATEWGIGAAGRAESAELCFAGQADYRGALGPEPDAGPGSVLDTAGRVIGRHKGISRYTIGQREGLGIAARTRLYVIAIDAASNTLVVGDREAASGRRVAAEHLNVLAPGRLERGGRLFGKIRSRLDAAPCSVIEYGPGRMVVEFDAPEHGVCPGQHLVLYTEAGRVVGGGRIVREQCASGAFDIARRTD
jgi:tRNA-specific 2-thiouridylase